MKQLIAFLLVFAMVAGVDAAPTGKAKNTARSRGATKAPAERVSRAGTANLDVRLDAANINLGRRVCLPAPRLDGASSISRAWTGKARTWIVMEHKYQVSDKQKRVDQLSATWHVILETSSATTKDREFLKETEPYSYFTCTINYSNIPEGWHATSACLHPSYLEQYGEPKAVGLELKDKDGNLIDVAVHSEIAGIKADPVKPFWEDRDIMESVINDKVIKDKGLDPTLKGSKMIEYRQGLTDRSKTIWALVNPDDYELVIQ